MDIQMTPEQGLQRSATKEIRQRTDDLESQVDKITIEKWQLTEEIQDLKTHYERELQSLFDQTKQETENFKSKESRLQLELKEAIDELADERTKAASERDRRRKLTEEMHIREDTIERLTAELESLGKNLASRQQKIEKLENEINKEADDDYDLNERAKELARLNCQLTSQLRERDIELRKYESERTKLETALQASQREVKKHLNDKREQAELIKCLEDELENAKEHLRTRDERLVQIKEGLQKEMADRILELRHEKMLLEEHIEELQENADFPRKSFDLSIHDELSSLDDFKPNRMSTPKGARNSRSSRVIGDLKQTDSLKIEIGEKDYLIKSLKADKEALEKQVAEMHQQVFQTKDIESKLKAEIVQKENALLNELKVVKGKYRMQSEEMENEIVELRSDIEKFQRQALRSAELWAEENNSMRTDLLAAERAAISAKLQYAEAATDLEILTKKLTDSQVKKKRFSFFKRNKS